MKHRIRRVVAARAQGDEGIAMVLVIGSIVVLSMLMAASMSYALNVQTQSRNNQDWHSALSAAQAGVDDYAARLNANAHYWRTIDCGNSALQGPNAGVNTCGWGPSTAVGWENVRVGDTDAQFHYDVDTSRTPAGGGIRLTVTGRSRDELRTLRVRVGKEGSTKFVYYTDFESADPANRTAYGASGATRADCGSNGAANAKYAWDGRDTTRCKEIQFISADELDGKVHFNDIPMMQNNARFLKGFETAAPGCKTGTKANDWLGCSRRTSGSGSAKPYIPDGQYAEYADVLYLPDNSDALLTAEGCHYTGDTRIKFSGSTMKVWSKGTSSVEAGCGTPGTSSGRLGHANGATVTVPNNKIVYAKNGTSGTAECEPGQIGDGLPLDGDVNFRGTENATFYCGTGNLFVEGTVKGRIGVGAQNNVIVTGDLLIDGVAKGQEPKGNSMVSLVASNSVVVYHPYVVKREWKCTSSIFGFCLKEGWVETVIGEPPGTTAKDRYIYASIQTLQHSFWVQSYHRGTDRGTLYVWGSIAQRWRGIVGQSGNPKTGYAKSYKYDQRLSNDIPPGIQDFTNGAWEPSVTGEISPVFDCTGDSCTVK